MQPRAKLFRTLRHGVSAIFLTGLFLPLLLFSLIIALTPQTLHTLAQNIHKTSSTASVSTPKPNWAHRFEAFWDTHLPLRQQWIIAFNAPRRALGIGLRNEVVVGRGGWLFGGKPEFLNDYRNVDSLTARKLNAWQHYLERQQRLARNHGARYVFALAPNKHSIYPDKLPYHLRPMQPQSRADQLMTHMARHSADVNVLDLRPVLQRARQQQRVYLPWDTHWNLIGAYHAYQALLQTLDDPSLTPAHYPPEAFQLASRPAFESTNVAFYNGLPRMLGMKRFSRPQPLLESLAARCAQPVRPQLSARWQTLPRERRRFVFQATRCNNASQRALLLRDSFTELMKPFLSEHFAYALYARFTPVQRPDYQDLLHSARPNVVIEIMVERTLGRDYNWLYRENEESHDTD